MKEKKVHSAEDLISQNLREIITYMGDNPFREGLQETPSRVIRSWEKLYSGYRKNPAELLKTFTEGACDEMVALTNIEFYSTCEHHMLPFFGKIHVAYIPNGKVVGVSKLARLVEVYARRLQIQERLVAQVADDLMIHLGAKGAMVICQAQHFCMTARGVEKQNSVMVTSAVRGCFKEQDVKNEFMSLIRMGGAK